MKTIKHEELFGGYSGRRKIIIDICQLSESEFETMAMYEDNGFQIDNELSCKAATTEAEAIKDFNTMIQEYAEPLQKALYNKLVEGGKYTLVYCNDFGFPVAQKITFHSMELTTYAQHSDVVKMVFTPFRKRKMYAKRFYNMSLMIFEGWQDLKDEDTKIITREDENVKCMMSKYTCFDSRYIDDLEHVFKNPVVIYKDYKTGVNGKIYA